MSHAPSAQGVLFTSSVPRRFAHGYRAMSMAATPAACGTPKLVPMESYARATAPSVVMVRVAIGFCASPPGAASSTSGP